MARMIKVGFDDQLTGTIESTPANRMVFKGSEDAQESLQSLVGFHLGNLVAALPPDAEDPTADEVLDYVVSRMRGKRAWAERVDPGFTDNAFCPTGEGGGQDNSCSPGGGSGGGRGELPSDPHEVTRKFTEIAEKMFGESLKPNPYNSRSRRVELEDGRHVDLWLRTNSKGLSTVQIDFGVSGRDNTPVGESMEKGSLDMVRKVRDIAKAYHQAGFRIMSVPSTDRKGEAYARVMTKMGFKLETEGDGYQVWNSGPCDWVVENAFCPTGEGGGQDNSCGPAGGSGGERIKLEDVSIETVVASAKKEYPRLRPGDTVDGREVIRKVDNQDSISASIDHYEILPGIREVRLDHLQTIRERRAAGKGNPRRPAADDERRVNALTEKIRASNKISALIVVDDGHDDGPYVLEGGHRIDAMERLGAKSVPAMVVLDLDGIDARLRKGEYPSGRLTRNTFCPTGDGGGIDPSCSPDGSGRGIAPSTTPLGKAPRLRGFGEAPSEAFQKEQARLDAEAKAAKTPKAAAKSAQPKVADDVPSALKATSSDVRRDVEGSLKDFRERRGRVTVGEARELADKLSGMTVKDMRVVASSMGVKTPSGKKAELVKELAERFREKIHADKGLKEVASGTWVHKGEADDVVARIRHEGGAAWRVDDMPGDSSSRDKVFVGFEGSAQQADKHGFPLSERVRARLAKASGRGRATKTKVKNEYTWNSGAFAELVRPLPVWLDPNPDGSVSVREPTAEGDEIKRVLPGQSFFEWSAPELWKLGRGAFELVPHSQAAAEMMLSDLDDDVADDVVFGLTEDDRLLALGDPNRSDADEEALADDFRRNIKGKLRSHSDDDHGDDTWRPIANAFCPTGAGGGQDNSCSPTGGGGGGEMESASLSKQVRLPAKDWTDDHTDRLMTTRIKDGEPNECYENARKEYAARKAAGEDVRYVVGTLYGVPKESMRPVGGVASDAMDYRATPIPHAWVETSSGKIADPTPFKYGHGDYRNLPSEPAAEHFHKALYVPEYSVSDESLGSKLSTFPSKGGSK